MGKEQTKAGAQGDRSELEALDSRFRGNYD
jgi:hypothetical protein